MNREVLLFLLIASIVVTFFHALTIDNKRSIWKSGKEKILLLTAIPPRPCKGPLGDYVNMQSIKNKLQYSHMKGLSFHFSTIQVDPLLGGPWNKLALVNYILESSVNYDWIFWLDVDALVYDMEFDLPLRDYSNYDFVLYGEEHFLFNEADALRGLNTGLFLIRNNEWGRSLIKNACILGKNGTERMKSTFKNYDPTLCDQNAIGFLLYTEKALRKRVFFERRNYFHGYWEEAKRLKQWKPFVIHFAGCEFCDGIGEGPRKDCIPLWKEFVNKSSQRFSKGLIWELKYNKTDETTGNQNLYPVHLSVSEGSMILRDHNIESDD